MNELLFTDTTTTIWACLVAAAIIGAITGWLLRGNKKKHISKLNNEWSERYTELEQERDKYKASLNTDSQSVLNFNDDTHNLQVSELGKKYKFLLTRTATLEKAAHKSKSALDAARQKLMTAEEEIVSLKDQVTASGEYAYENLSDDAQAELREADDKIANLTQALTESDKQLTTTKKRLTDNESELFKLNEMISSKDESIEKLHTQLKEVKDELGDITIAKVSAEKNTAEMKDILLNKDNEINKLTDELNNFGNIDNFEKQENNKTIAELTNQLATQQEALHISQQDLESTKNELSTAHDHLDKAKSAIGLLENYIKEEHQKENDVKEKSIIENEQKTQTLEKTLIERDQEIAQKIEFITQLEKKIEGKNSDLEKASTELAKTKLKLKQTTTNIDDINNRYNKVTSELDQTKSALTTKQSDFDKSQAAISAMESYIKNNELEGNKVSSNKDIEPKQEIANLKGTIDSLQKQIIDKDNELNLSMKLLDKKNIELEQLRPQSNSSSNPIKIKTTLKPNQSTSDAIRPHETEEKPQQVSEKVIQTPTLVSTQDKEVDIQNLTYLNGIDGNIASALYQAGIHSLTTLSKNKVKVLTNKLNLVNQRENLLDATPSQEQLESWIEQAKNLVK